MPRLIFLFLFLVFFSTSVHADIAKIVLWEKGEPSDLLPTAKQWKWIDFHSVAVDDFGNIYVLNPWKKTILVYNQFGDTLEPIKLDDRVRMKVDRLPRFFGVEVLGRGDRLLITSKALHYIVDRKGNLLKTLGSLSDVIRHCGDVYTNMYGDLHSKEDYADLQISPSRSSWYRTSSGENIKYYKDYYEKIAVVSSIPPEFRDTSGKLIGIDCNNEFVYRVFSKSDKRYSIVKFDSKGNYIGADALPFSISDMTPKEWGELASGLEGDEPLKYPKMSCNGNVYYIYAPWQLMSDSAELNKYFIYKFSFSTDKEDVSKVVNQLTGKEYLGSSELYEIDDLVCCGSGKEQKLYVRLLRNEIFARHGRSFQSEDLNSVFKQTDWYKENPKYSDDLLNEIEKQNIKFIYDFEKAQGWR